MKTHIFYENTNADECEAHYINSAKRIESLMQNEIGQHITVINFGPDMWSGGMGSYAYAWTSGELQEVKRDNDCYEDLDAGYQFHFKECTEKHYAPLNKLTREYFLLSEEETNKILKPMGYIQVNETMGIIITPNITIISGMQLDNKKQVSDMMQVIKTTGLIPGGSETIRLISDIASTDILSDLINTPSVMQNAELTETILETWKSKAG